MSDLSALSKESVKSLGAGAYLVNALPSAVLVLTIVALYDSRLFPWSQQRTNDGEPIARGPASVLDAFSDRGIPGAIVLALAVLVVAVLLRPFQIRTVQLLEGYWKRTVSSRPSRWNGTSDGPARSRPEGTSVPRTRR